MTMTKFNDHMKENKPYITTPGINKIAPEGLMPILAGFRTAGHTLPYKMYLFTFSNPSGSTLVYESHINTIDKDLIVEYAGVGGNFRITTSTGKPIKGFSKPLMAFCCLTNYYSLLGGALPYAPIITDEKINWSSANIPIYTVDSFAEVSEVSAQDQLCLLILFDLPGEQVNVNVQTT